VFLPPRPSRQCWSEALKRSSQCPICRTEIQEVRRNHDLANLVEAYLPMSHTEAADSTIAPRIRVGLGRYPHLGS
jgi:hypothetical protein